MNPRMRSIAGRMLGRRAAVYCLPAVLLSVLVGYAPWIAHGAGLRSQTAAAAVLLKATGHGKHTTGTVSVPGPWSLGWSFACGGKRGQFMVTAFKSGRHASLARLTRRGASGHGTLLVRSGGRVYLVVATTCVWHLTVTRQRASSPAGTAAPSATATPRPTASATPTDTASPSASPTTTPTASPTPTATPTPTLTATPPPAATTTSTGAPSPSLSLRVNGNQLVNGRGQTIRLIGVNVPAGIQCIAGGPHVPLGIFSFPSAAQTVAAIAGWHANAVRITLNEDCWLGINGGDPTYTGENYRTAVESFVADLNSAGIYVIVDLHTNAPGTTLATSQQAMADADHAYAYWTSVAGAFKSDPAVIFQPYNEPHITTANAQTTNPWQCWRDGCMITELDHDQNTPVPGAAPWQGAGMQSLVDAIRATGATNPILIDGLNWAQDLTQLPQYLPHDPLQQLIVDYHNYMSPGSKNTPAYWNSVIAPIAARMPVMTSEFGEKDCGSAYVTQYMQWADQHGVSYMPWVWMTWDCSAMGLISSWDGTPSAYGQPFYGHFHQ